MTYSETYLLGVFDQKTNKSLQATSLKAYRLRQTRYPQKRQQTLCASLTVPTLPCGKPLKAAYHGRFTQADEENHPYRSKNDQNRQRLESQGFQRYANRLSTEAPTRIVGNIGHRRSFVHSKTRGKSASCNDHFLTNNRQAIATVACSHAPTTYPHAHPHGM
ncbi:hypothetical protein LZ023_06755 [Pseudomonas silvicola]|nr:hypothetical protein LZ023_06755 [Pseudomonas silvicola]